MLRSRWLHLLSSSLLLHGLGANLNILSQPSSIVNFTLSNHELSISYMTYFYMNIEHLIYYTGIYFLFASEPTVKGELTVVVIAAASNKNNNDNGNPTIN
jgi:hypothetical protein